MFALPELTSRVVAVLEKYKLKQGKLSLKSVASACTPSPELCVTPLACLASVTPENSRRLSFQSSNNKMDAASDKLGLAALPSSAAPSADPAGLSPSAGTSKSPQLILAFAPPNLCAVSTVRVQNYIVDETHRQNSRKISKTDTLDGTTAKTNSQGQMARFSQFHRESAYKFLCSL